MLGNTLFFNFANNKKFNVRGSIRGNCKINFYEYNSLIDESIDIFKFDDLKKKIIEFKPNIVINCVGWIKQKKYNENNAIFLNKDFPKKLNNFLKKKKIKLIHFSTDCVFDGKMGDYEIYDSVNASDIYGISKSLGEIKSNNCLIIRTSIIGHEVSSSYGLLEWFLKKKNKCYGFTNAFFSGVTTYEVYKFILKFLVSKKKLSGIYHLSSKKISKFELIYKIRKIYKKKIKIIKNDRLKIDRSLSNYCSQKKFKFSVSNWNKMIEELKKNKFKFKQFYNT